MIDHGNPLLLHEHVVIKASVRGSATLLTTSGNVYSGGNDGEVAISPVAGTDRTLTIWELSSMNVNVSPGRSNPFPNSKTGLKDLWQAPLRRPFNAYSYWAPND